MAYQEFDGELDEPTYTKFSGKLDAPRSRTWGEALEDTGRGLMSGAAGLVKSSGDLYGLATGDMDNTASELGRNAQEHWQSGESHALKDKKATRKAAIDAEEGIGGKAWEAFKGTVSDPALAVDTVASNVASLIPGAVVGKLAAGAKLASGLNAASKVGPASMAARELAAKAAGSFGTKAAIAAGGLQQGADVSGDVYAAAMNKSDAQWAGNPEFAQRVQDSDGSPEAISEIKHELALKAARVTLPAATAISVAANAIPGATMLERSLVGGAARETLEVGAKFAIPKAIAKGAAGEMAQEGIEEGGGAFSGNAAKRGYVDPAQDLREGVGENAGMGMAGGFLLGAAGGSAHRAAPASVAAVTPADIVSPNVTSVDQAIAVSQAAMDAGRQFQDLAISTPGDELAMQRQISEASGNLAARAQAQAQIQSEREGAAAGAARDQRLTDAGQAWQDLGVAAPQDDLQAQRTGMRPVEADESPTAMQLALQRAQSKAVNIPTKAPDGATDGVIPELAGYVDAAVKFGNETPQAQAQQTTAEANQWSGAVDAGASEAVSGIQKTGSGQSVAKSAQFDGASQNDRSTSRLVQDRPDSNSVPSFDFTRNDSGTVLVHGDPVAIRAAFPQEHGITKFTGGQPAGVLFGIKSAPQVEAVLMEPELQGMAAAAFEQLHQQDVKEEIKQRLDLAKPAEVDQKKTPFKSFLREFGIQSEHTSDIAGKNRFNANNVLPATFRANSMSLDGLVEQAIERGFMQEGDRGNQNKLIEMIQAEIAGEAQVSSEFADGDAQARSERSQRAEIESQADRLGLPYDPSVSVDRLASMVRRVQSRLEKEVDASFNGRGSLKSERVLRDARETVARIERKRAQYERELQAFADLNIAEQDALLEILADADGNPVIVHKADMDAEAAWVESQGQWSEQNGQADAAKDGVARQDQAPPAGVSEEGVGRAAPARTQAQPRSPEAPADQEGLIAPSRADVLAQQDRAEAEAQRKKDGGDKPIAAKPFTADQVDLFNPQASIFDAPAEPPKPASEMTASELLRAAADKMDAEKAPAAAQDSAQPAAKGGRIEDSEQGAAMFSRADNIDVSDLRTGISSVLLELGKINSLYQYPRSSKTSLEGIAADKGMTISDVDRNTEDGKLWMIANTTPTDAPGVKSWIVTLPGGKHATLTNKSGEVYINVSAVGEGQGGSRVYDLAANYAFNNGLKFIGDPNGVSPAAMRRRLENMLSAAIKYGSTDFLAPHADQIDGRPDIGVPALRWTDGDTLGNIRSMVDVSVASTKSTNPAATQDVRFDPATHTLRDGRNDVVDARRLSEMLGDEERTRGTGQAGNTTLRRNALFNSLLQSVGNRAATMEFIHRQQDRGGSGIGGALEGSFYSHGAVRNPSTVERVQSAVAELIGTKQLPNQLGRVVATTAAEIKSHWEALIDKSVNIGSEGDAGVAQAFYDPRTKTVFLIADHISQGNEVAVLAHELMHKHGQAVLGKEGWDRLHGVISSWEHAPADSEEHAVYTYARNKVAAVGDHLSSQELFPYAVEAALKMGIQPSMAAKKGTVARWLESVRQNIRMVWEKITGKPETFKAQDLVDLAFGIAQRENPAHGDVAGFRGTNESVTNPNDVVGNQGGRSADDTSTGTDEATGLPLNADGTVTVFHHTTAANAKAIRQTGVLKAQAEPDVYVTTRRETDTGYGDTAVAIRVQPDKLTIDDEFPDGRKDFRLSVGKPGGSIKVTAGNESTAPDSGGAQFSRTAANPHSWDAPEASKFDDLVYKLQDKNIDTKRVIESIRETAGALADENDVYLQEELFHGRAAARTEDFVSKELGPLINEMRMRGIDIQTLDEYLHARHAEEANELIAQRNPDLQDGGSGMTTRAARDYLAKLDPAERKRLEAVAAKVDVILTGTRQLYADYSLESQDKVDGWGTMFKHYVPLMREDKDGAMGIGQGFSIKGKEVKGRTGSTRKVVDILANIAMQRERAIVRGEKNRVATALVGLVELNQNEEFWAVGPPPLEKVYDEKTDSVVERADPLFKSRENVIIAKVKQADGEVVEKSVRFNEDNERAMRMAAALKNLDAAQLNGVLGLSAKITRYFAAINTQYNPIFGVVNLVRDFQGAILNLSTTPLKGHAKEIAGHTLSALKGVYLDARAARDGKPQTSAWAMLWEEFQAEGGQTGYRDLFASSADRAKAIEYELNPTAWMDSPLGKVFTANGALRVPLALAQKNAEGLFGWLSDYNLAMENAVRLSAYKVGLEQGMSKQQAASLGKNLTVNFNRKGQVGQQAGAIYAFFNASMQGSARIGKTLFDMDGNNAKSIRLSAIGKKIVYGGMLLGTMQALLLAAAGFDDEEPPDFVRERSLIIPTGGKSYITIPMPLGLHVIPNMGRIPTEFVLGGFRNPAKHVIRLMGLTAGAFNPIGGGASLVQMLSPTAVDPLVALAENKDWTGKPIAKTSFNKATPGHALMKDTASAPSKLLAEAINTLTGGSKYTAGVFSPTPDQIDYLWGQATGGVGREIGKAQQTVSATLSGEDLPVHKIPLIGRFYGNADTQSAQSGKFYATINRLNEHEAEIKGLRKDRKVVELADYIKANPDARLFDRANAVEREVQRLRRLKREMTDLDAPPERIKTIEARITQMMTGFNEQADRLKQTP